MMCRELLTSGQENVCPDCYIKIPRLISPLCFKCGKEIENEEEEYCLDCTTHKRSYVRGFPGMLYEEPLKASVAAFKYSGKKSYGKWYAKEIMKRHGEEIMVLGIEALIPVPIHRKKLRKRGYNQAQTLAEDLGVLLDIPVDTGLLKRTINTTAQKELDDVEREKNLKDAFISTKEIVKYKKVLLVDDIYTTGATIEACTRALINMGIQEVYYTSICIGKGK